MTDGDPDCFARHLAGQHPPFLWIGCADSREPAEQIVDAPPGELFVHRNIANRIDPDDTNARAVIEYAVGALHIEHIVVCGHYGCGGVRAAMEAAPTPGALGRWLEPVRRLRERHEAELATLADAERKLDRLCELNVAAQVAVVAELPSVRAAWAEGQPLSVHGWIYRLCDGLLRDLRVSVSGPGPDRPTSAGRHDDADGPERVQDADAALVGGQHVR